MLDAAPAASTMMITCMANMIHLGKSGESVGILCSKMPEQESVIRRTFFKKVNLVFWFVKVRLRDGYSWDNQSETT